MNKRREQILLIAALFAIFLFCVLLWYGKTVYRYQAVNYTRVVSQDGVWDLRDIDFSTQIVHLSGSVRYIPDQILSPEQFAAQEAQALIGDPVDVNAGRTAALKLLLPDEGHYRLLLRGDYARRIFVDGELRGGFGEPAATAEEFVPQFAHVKFDAKAGGGDLDLIIQGGNFSHREGSSYSDVMIGSATLLDRFVGLQRVLELITFGMLLALVAVHLMLSFVPGGRLINATFSTVCLVFALRVGLVGGKVLYLLFPRLQWQLAIRLEYLTLSLSGALLLIILYLQFKEGMHRWVVRVLLSIFGLFSLAFMTVDSVTMSRMLEALHAVHVLCILYLLVSVMRVGVKRRRFGRRIGVERGLAAVALLVLSLATVNDIIYFTGFRLSPTSEPMSEVAVLAFSAFEALAISYRTMHALRRAQRAERMAKNEAEALSRLAHMKTEFLQEMSHEMRTPLCVIGTGIEHVQRQLSREAPQPDKVRGSLEMIGSETARLSRMVAGMVAMAELGPASNRKKVDFSALLNSAAERFSLLAEQQGTALFSEVSRALPPVFADEDSFARVLSNLFENGLRHTEGGRIKLQARREGEFIAVSLSDNGCGMALEQASDALRRAVSHSGGTGLGLYIAKTVVEAHGGELWIESSLGEGTTVHFTVPVYAGQEAGFSG